MRVRTVLVVFAAAAALSASHAAADVGPDTLSVSCGVAGQPQPPPCTSGWYTSPVSVVWSASSGLALGSGGLCAERHDCLQQRSGDAAVLHGDLVRHRPDINPQLPAPRRGLDPAASATPDRPPDANGWYNHPVTVTLAGTAFSGIAACTPAQTYGGPATAATRSPAPAPTTRARPPRRASRSAMTRPRRPSRPVPSRPTVWPP